MRGRGFLLVALAAGVVALGAGATLPVLAQAAGTTAGTVGPLPRDERLPYTVEYKVTHVQTLADGNTITRESTEVEAVDSRGRRMSSTTSDPLPGEPTPSTRVFVFDTAAHTTTEWDSRTRRATVFTLPSADASQNCSSITTSGNSVVNSSGARDQHANRSDEDLGTETIQGIKAHGHRMITITPAGEIGNAAPLVRTMENWIAVAPGMRPLILRQKIDDPQTGTKIKELVNLTTSEPDPATFQPPEGYGIVNNEAQEPCAHLAAPSPAQP